MRVALWMVQNDVVFPFDVEWWFARALESIKKHLFFFLIINLCDCNAVVWDHVLIKWNMFLPLRRWDEASDNSSMCVGRIFFILMKHLTILQCVLEGSSSSLLVILLFIIHQTAGRCFKHPLKNGLFLLLALLTGDHDHLCKTWKGGTPGFWGRPFPSGDPPRSLTGLPLFWSSSLHHSAITYTSYVLFVCIQIHKN